MGRIFLLYCLNDNKKIGSKNEIKRRFSFEEVHHPDYFHEIVFSKSILSFHMPWNYS